MGVAFYIFIYFWSQLDLKHIQLRFNLFQIRVSSFFLYSQCFHYFYLYLCFLLLLVFNYFRFHSSFFPVFLSFHLLLFLWLAPSFFLLFFRFYWSCWCSVSFRDSPDFLRGWETMFCCRELVVLVCFSPVLNHPPGVGHVKTCWNVTKWMMTYPNGCIFVSKVCSKLIYVDLLGQAASSHRKLPSWSRASVEMVKGSKSLDSFGIFGWFRDEILQFWYISVAQSHSKDVALIGSDAADLASFWLGNFRDSI